MELDKSIIQELKNTILKSRYQATRLVNKELIVLYFNIGKKINDTASKETWGSKVLSQISAELQNELPGLRGFSAGNLKKMRVFTAFWAKHPSIGSTMSNQLENSPTSISSTPSSQIPENFANIFSALDDTIKQPHKSPFIGIILCKEKNNKIVEFSFRDFNKAMWVATYKTSSELPDKFRGTIPDSETFKKRLD